MKFSFIFFFILFFANNIEAMEDYELLKKYSNKSALDKHKMYANKITFWGADSNKMDNYKTEKFNSFGYPILIENLNELLSGIDKKFIYKNDTIIQKIETFENTHLTEYSEFLVNEKGLILSVKNYKKRFMSDTFYLNLEILIRYNKNLLKEVIEVHKNGTITEFYDTLGYLQYITNSNLELRSKRIECIWSKDKNSMYEKHIEYDTICFLKVYHKYQNGKEIERKDIRISNNPTIWNYDNKGRLIYTNESMFYSEKFYYDELDNIKIRIIYGNQNKNTFYKYKLELNVPRIFGATNQQR